MRGSLEDIVHVTWCVARSTPLAPSKLPNNMTNILELLTVLSFSHIMWYQALGLMLSRWWVAFLSLLKFHSLSFKVPSYFTYSNIKRQSQLFFLTASVLPSVSSHNLSFGPLALSTHPKKLLYSSFPKEMWVLLLNVTPRIGQWHKRHVTMWQIVYCLEPGWSEFKTQLHHWWNVWP